MSTLSNKSAQEISELLDEYGIKHGPVVDSTRSLYEKKLREAMAKEKNVKPSSDKTYYREEQEEVTYVTHRTPLRNEASGDGKPYMRSRPEYTERDFVDERPYSRSKPEYSGRDFVDEPYVYNTQASYSNVSHSTPMPMKSGRDGLKEETSSTRMIPLWVQFLVFLVVAGFLYVVFTNMESTESNPFKRLQ